MAGDILHKGLDGVVLFKVQGLSHHAERSAVPKSSLIGGEIYRA